MGASFKGRTRDFESRDSPFNSARACQFAYIAGLFDGEGHANVIAYRATKNGHKYFRLVLQITNTYRPALDEIKAWLGFGSVHRHRRGSGFPAKNGRKPCFRYVTSNTNAVRLLGAIRPYLLIKAAHTDRLMNGQINGRAD